MRLSNGAAANFQLEQVFGDSKYVQTMAKPPPPPLPTASGNVSHSENLGGKSEPLGSCLPWQLFGLISDLFAFGATLHPGSAW